MQLSPLLAVSPIDGRYWQKASSLSTYFSEYALIRYRLLVEIEYFIMLAGVLPELKSWTDLNNAQLLRDLYNPSHFGEKEAQIIKDKEKITNHDIKAVEYYLKEKFDDFGWKHEKEFVHFGLTSQDINNTAIPLLLKHAIENAYLPNLQAVLKTLSEMAEKYMNIPMLARTHGQPATPTRVGKELMVFVYRAQQQIKLMTNIPHTAKFGGATGQFNAHHVAYPSIDWLHFSDKFISSLGLEREQWTTQISNYDNLSSLMDSVRRVNTIFLDFCKDMWQYIALGYFKQKIVEKEVGSSAMPHKVNPIDFENAEGNFGISNALLEHMSSKLPVSRLQRDLTDSTVLRNLGVPFGHILVSFDSLKRGFGKILLNEDQIKKDLTENYIVVSEAIQTVLRRESYPEPYEALKKLTRTGEALDRTLLNQWIDTTLNHNLLEESRREQVLQELKQITPFNFIGVVPKL